jgi:hypothetical protein
VASKKKRSNITTQKKKKKKTAANTANRDEVQIFVHSFFLQHSNSLKKSLLPHLIKMYVCLTWQQDRKFR